MLAGCFCRLKSATVSLLGENGCFLVTADYWKCQVSRRYSYLQYFCCNSVWLSTFWVCAYGSICFSLCSSSRTGTNITLRAALNPSRGKNWHSVAAHQIVVSLKLIALNWKWHIQCYHKTVNLQKPGRRMNPFLIRN